MMRDIFFICLGILVASASIASMIAIAGELAPRDTCVSIGPFITHTAP